MSRRPRLVVATGNPGKLREFAALAAAGPLDALVEVVGPGEPGLLAGPYEPPEEHSPVLAENAAAKARQAAAATGLVAVADDTGLYVQALGGRPGPRAARYAG
ncbi:MAG TPA: non-canonical purine NTP pyrophosphatase, partial [Limnochordales bacterium]